MGCKSYALSVLLYSSRNVEKWMRVISKIYKPSIYLVSEPSLTHSDLGTDFQERFPSAMRTTQQVGVLWIRHMLERESDDIARAALS